MNIRAAISNKELSFTETEKKIADYLLKHGQCVAQMNSTQLGEAVGTSQSSIIKFIHKLGFSRFGDFKLQIYEDFIRKKQMNLLKAQRVSLEDPFPWLMQGIYEESIESLRHTCEGLHDQPVSECIAWMEQARRIYICGKGASYFPAQDLAGKLLKFGFTIICLQDLETMEISAGGASDGDVYLCFSYSGESEELKRIFVKAKAGGAKTIVITKNAHSTLKEMSDLCLTIVTNEPHDRIASMSSRIAFFSIVDVLFLGILKSDLHERLRMVQ